MKHVVALLILMGGFFANAQRLGTETHGGDEIGLEFHRAVKAALEDIQANHPDLYEQIRGLNLDSFKPKVMVVEKPLVVTVNGVRQSSVAVNTSGKGKDLVQVNRPRWRGIRNPVLMRGVALHEVLCLKKLEKTGEYPISGVYVQRAGLKPSSLGTGRASSGEYKYLLTGSRCTRLDKVQEKTTGKTLDIQAQTNGTSVEWNQDGHLYRAVLTGMSFDRTEKKVSIELSRIRQTLSEGRVAQVEGEIFSSWQSGRQVLNQKMAFTQRNEFISAEEQLEHFEIDGKPLPPARTTTKILADGRKQTSKYQELSEESGEYRYVSMMFSCEYGPRDPAELEAIVPPVVNEVAETFSGAITDVDNAAASLENCRRANGDCATAEKILAEAARARDDIWASFVAPVSKPVAKVDAPVAKKKPTVANKGRKSTGEREMTPRERVLNNPLLLDMLYRNSPFARFGRPRL